MARYKRKRRRMYRKGQASFRRSRTVAKKKKRRSKRKSTFGNLAPYIGAAIYGGARSRISSALDPIVTSKIGALGGYADEVVMLAANYGVGKFLPMSRPVTKAGMLIESARIGEKAAMQFLGGSSGTVATSNPVVYS